MTVDELYENALARTPKLRPDRQGRVRWPKSNLKRWLDARVEAGWLEQRGDRYYLTHAGHAVAGALADEYVLGDRIAA